MKEKDKELNKLSVGYRKSFEFEDGNGGSFLVEIYPDENMSITQTGSHFGFSLDKWPCDKIDYFANELLALTKELRERLNKDFRN